MKKKINVTVKGSNKKQIGVLGKNGEKVTIATGAGLKDVDIKDVKIN